jgi:hypothetical protein
MSWEALGWVWKRDIRPSARKLIAVAIADAADDEGICRLKHRTLAVKCGLSYDSVRGHIRELESSGVLVREARNCEDGSQGANEYRITPCEPIPTPSPDESTEGVGAGAQPSLNRVVNPSVKPPPTPNAQSSLLPDPVNETWSVYVAALDRPKAVLTPKVRKWIADAHQAIGVEMTRQAIEGLAASDYHRENGYVGIEYAIVPKRGETIEGRAEKMSARVRTNASSPEKGSLAELAADIRSKHGKGVLAESLLDGIEQVQAWLRNHDHPGLRSVGERAASKLRQFGYELVIDGQIVTGYRKVAE